MFKQFYNFIGILICTNGKIGIGNVLFIPVPYNRHTVTPQICKIFTCIVIAITI